MRLVADIGGTNTRVALAGAAASRSYRNADFLSFEAVLQDFLTQSDAQFDQLVVAMAGPVTGNTGRLTNLDWRIDGAELSARFGGAQVRGSNELTALGYAALDLRDTQLIPVLPRAPRSGSVQQQALVVGIGTGFNLSPVLRANGHTLCPAVEAGHVSLPSVLVSGLDQIQSGLGAQFASVEALFSGRGRRRFLSLVTGQEILRATPYLERQGQADNQVFDQALDHYARLIGLYLSELKIAYLPDGGIYLAGGVARSSLVGNRIAICAKAARRENPVIKADPGIWIIADDAAALTGCGGLYLGPAARA
jgi:glucokinase